MNRRFGSLSSSKTHNPMFQSVEAAAPDAILGLNEAFRQDSNPNKINLSVGQYKDANGKTPVLRCVKKAEALLLENEMSKGYLDMTGHPEYDRLVPELLLGAAHPSITENRLVTMQTPGGTGALRVAADFLHRVFPNKSVWMSQPTWPNHPNIFKAAGVPVKSYAYYDDSKFALDFDAMLADLQKIPNGDVVLLHGCCHNPTGVDLLPDHWDEVGKIVKDRNLLPLVDFAYQGFADGLDEDAAGLRTLTTYVDELLVCSSFSKNFGLYRERVGAFTVVAESTDVRDAVLSRDNELGKCHAFPPDQLFKPTVPRCVNRGHHPGGS
jgi:aspartate/tyrosine/aromatic aminotransferase